MNEVVQSAAFRRTRTQTIWEWIRQKSDLNTGVAVWEWEVFQWSRIFLSDYRSSI